MSTSISPLALPFPDMPPIAGVTARTARARYKSWDRADLTFVALDPGTAVAGVLTQSKCPSPEVEWCRKALVLGEARALVVNAGNSNAFTGNRGRAAVEAIAARVAAHVGCQPSDVFVASTGVIGVPLPIDKAEAGLDAAFAASPCGWAGAAATIAASPALAAAPCMKSRLAIAWSRPNLRPSSSMSGLLILAAMRAATAPSASSLVAEEPSRPARTAAAASVEKRPGSAPRRRNAVCSFGPRS